MGAISVVIWEPRADALQNNGLEQTGRAGVPASRAVVGVTPRSSSQCSTDQAW
jgi:hypothetical protein